MKILIVSLLLLLGASSPVASQIFGKKKLLETPKTNSKIDSITKVNQALTLKADFLSKEVEKYFGIYAVIREKLIHYNFDPAKMSFLIDSLKASRESMLKANIDSIKTVREKGMTAIPADDIERSKAISNLKQIKELLDAKIISDAEFLSLKQKYLSNL